MNGIDRVSVQMKDGSILEVAADTLDKVELSTLRSIFRLFEPPSEECKCAECKCYELKEAILVSTCGNKIVLDKSCMTDWLKDKLSEIMLEQKLVEQGQTIQVVTAARFMHNAKVTVEPKKSE